MKKMKIKDAVNYFDANYSLKEIGSHFVTDYYNEVNHFDLIAMDRSSDGLLISTPLYHSSTFESCKRHLKYFYLSCINRHTPLFFRIRYSSVRSFGSRYIGDVDYVVKFKFDHHEELCNV